MSKIALLPGGFKPPHAGHYNMAKWLLDNTDADVVVIKVGSKERDGITREMSLDLWDLYTQDDYNITVKASDSNSPVRDVYDFIENEAPEGSTVYLGMGEKDINDARFNNIGKFAKPKNINFETKLVPPQAGGVSGTEMRGFITNNNKELFQKYLPNHINKEQAWNIVTGLEEVFSKDWWLNQLTEVFSDNQATINDQLIPLEIMNSPEEQMRGMMGRDDLEGGMLFPYDNPKEVSFHMKNCLIPLDIVFIINNKVSNIHHNCPPCLEDNCPQYTGTADNVLELPGGYCQGNNINVGDLVNLNSIEEDLYNPEDKVLDYMRSSEWKAGMPDGPKDDIPRAYKYKRGGRYNAASGQGGAGTMYEMMSGTMTKQEKAKHNKKLKQVNKFTNKINKGDQYVEVPKSLKQNRTLTRKLYELEDHEIRFFAMHADILKQLNTPNFKIKYQELSQQLKGERLEALEYFYNEYLSKLDDNCEIEEDRKYGAHDALSQYKDKISSDYGHQKYRDLQLLISQNKNEKVNNWLKTKGYMNETRLFSKDWWLDIITEHLLTEGGAAGHMAHPFNLPNVNSGKDLKNIFIKSAESLQNNPGAVKIDGVNSSIRLIDLGGQKQFVMDRGSKKPLDIKGITKSDLEDRFKPGHGMVKVGGEVLDMFNEALPSLQNDLEKLGAWDDPNILFNMEYVSGKTNVQDYGSNFIAIHGLNKMETKEVQGKRKMLTKRFSTEFNYDKSTLQSLLDNLVPIANKRGFEVYGSVPTEMTNKPNFNNALSQKYTVEFTEENKTQTLEQWLNELDNIPEEDFIFMNIDGSRKKVGAVSKQVYLSILQGENVDDLFEEDRDKAIKGFVTYLATEKLGDEILKVLDSPMGSVEDHEGVVIRDEKITNVPFKITGKFILGGMVSDF